MSDSIFNDAKKYWNSKETRAKAHWLGNGVFGDQERWQGIGKFHDQHIQELIKQSGRTKPIDTMIEWGCGGGANAVVFAPGIQSYTGVDISQDTLNECEKQVRTAGGTFRPYLVPIENPEAILAQQFPPYDLFLSTAVFQHFPSKSYGERITRIASELLAEDGIALIQVRHDDGSERFRPKVKDYSKHAMTFTSYKDGEFRKVCESVGFRVLYDTVSGSQYHYHYLVKDGN